MLLAVTKVTCVQCAACRHRFRTDKDAQSTVHQNGVLFNASHRCLYRVGPERLVMQVLQVTYGRPPPRTTQVLDCWGWTSSSFSGSDLVSVFQALQRTTASNVSMTQDLVGLELNCRSISRNLSSVSSWNERGERGERASGKGLPISAWTPSGAARRVHHDSPASRHSPRSRLSASVPRLQLSSQQSRYDGLVISTDRPGSRTPTVQSLSWKRAPAASRPVTSRSEEASRRRENTLISPFTGAVSSRWVDAISCENTRTLEYVSCGGGTAALLIFLSQVD